MRYVSLNMILLSLVLMPLACGKQIEQSSETKFQVGGVNSDDCKEAKKWSFFKALFYKLRCLTLKCLKIRSEHLPFFNESSSQIFRIHLLFSKP